MVTQNFLYDAILYIYALSLLFYFSDFMNASRRAKRIGTGLLIFVWVLQTGYLVSRIVSHLQMTAVTAFEYWLGFSWLLVTISLVISRFIKIDFVVFFVNVISFAVLALNLYSNPGERRIACGLGNDKRSVIHSYQPRPLRIRGTDAWSLIRWNVYVFA